jgi:6-phosphogluconolactonase (cycloisomerase 2 family)
MYVTNQDSNTVTILKVNNKTGTLRKLSTADSDKGPISVLATSNNSWVFVLAETSGTLTSYRPSSGTGSLQSVSKVSLEKTPRFMVLHPLLKVIYVANRGSDSISVVGYDETSGVLTVLQTLALATNTLPYSLCIDENGKILYSVDWGPGLLGKVATYKIDSSSGLLTLASEKEVGTFPTSVLVIKGTNYLLVSNYGEGSVITLKKDDDTGVLQSLSTLSVGNGPTQIVSSPLGKYIFILSSNDNKAIPCTLSDSGGVACTSGTSVGITPSFAVTDSSGAFLFVANSGSSNNVSILGFSSSTGALSSIGGQATDAKPMSIGIVKILSPR